MSVECGLMWFGDPEALDRMTPDARAKALGWQLWRAHTPLGWTAAPMTAHDFASLHSSGKATG